MASNQTNAGYAANGTLVFRAVAGFELVRASGCSQGVVLGEPGAPRRKRKERRIDSLLNLTSSRIPRILFEDDK